MAKAKFHDWREWRRFRAIRLMRLGWQQRAIAAALGSTEAAVSQWIAAYAEGGRSALRSHPHPGHPKLSRAQKRLLPDFLWHGAEAYGFRGDVWTCARIAKVIKREFGFSLHKDHVSRLLKELGWTPQIPITRAIQRNEKAIVRWRRDVWPKLKRKARRERRTLVFTDESGFYLLPSVVRTYGRRGKTPVVYEWQTRDHLSVMGAVTWDGHWYTMVRQVAFTGLHCVAFLEHLLRYIRGKILLIWDNSPIHRRAAVKRFLADAEPKRIHLEAMPTYAPDLNPVEWGWKHLKYVEMKNLTCLDLEELHYQLYLAVARIRQKPEHIFSFFEGAELDLENT
jgi:transposase